MIHETLVDVIGLCSAFGGYLQLDCLIQKPGNAQSSTSNATVQGVHRPCSTLFWFCSGASVILEALRYYLPFSV